MKSFVMTCVFLFSCGLLAAEDMKFVTLLSQPVGSFSRVELLDTSKPAEIFHLNFCNTDASGGTFAVSGSDTYPVQAEKLRVLDGATLGGNIKPLTWILLPSAPIPPLTVSSAAPSM